MVFTIKTSPGPPTTVRPATGSSRTSCAQGISRSSRSDLYGTVVVEGNGSSGCGGSRDLWHKNGSRIWTADERLRIPSRLSIFDPVDAVNLAPQPTANPLNPQGVCADMGSASGTEIHGLVYSGRARGVQPHHHGRGRRGLRDPDPVHLLELRLRPHYGNAAPPPGLPGWDRAIRWCSSGSRSSVVWTRRRHGRRQPLPVGARTPDAADANISQHLGVYGPLRIMAPCHRPRAARTR